MALMRRWKRAIEEEETTANRQLAKDLVENWSRTIFNKNARDSYLKNTQEEVAIPLKKTSPVKKQSTMEVREVDLDLESYSSA
ncbi:hypothetical protein V6N13_091710 [Hibiscus sabdariffa]|uniref:TFIIS N-terminal domain-containing protein n=1 Tax=Hibiscus sabdariffa TaxID=183260 RepID=A0ABR2QF78_9ROSI